MPYRIVAAFNEDTAAWLSFSQTGGTIAAAGGSCAVMVYFRRSTVGRFASYLVVQNRADPSNSQVVRVSMEVVVDPKRVAAAAAAAATTTAVAVSAVNVAGTQAAAIPADVIENNSTGDLLSSMVSSDSIVIVSKPASQALAPLDIPKEAAAQTDDAAPSTISIVTVAPPPPAPAVTVASTSKRIKSKPVFQLTAFATPAENKNSNIGTEAPSSSASPSSSPLSNALQLVNVSDLPLDFSVRTTLLLRVLQALCGRARRLLPGQPRLLLLHQLGAQPRLCDAQQWTGLALRAQLLVHLEVPDLALPAGVALVAQVVQVRGPVVQAVEYVRRVEDGGAARLGLVLQPAQQVLAHHHVQRHRHLVQQQYLEGANEAQEDLHPPSLPVRHLVHAPLCM